jgi:ACS family glucarate transporter-like MFS transporter
MPSRLRIRWIMMSLLVAFAFFAYVQRISISVVAAPLMSEGGLTQIQIGWALTSFLIAYTIFQLPGGLLGEWLGARRTLPLINLAAIVAMVAVAVGPLLLGGSWLLICLISACFLLGIAQAPFFPICAGVIEAWFPSGKWGTPQGIHSAGALVGGSVAAPLTAWLVQALGWKAALALPCIPALALLVFWAWYARSRPAAHPSVSAAELAELSSDQKAERPERVTLSDIARVLRNKNVLLLSASYCSMNYVFYLLSFWSFLYLVQERHFSILEGGALASIPYAGAALGGFIGGISCDRLCRIFGVRVGFRLLPLIALPIAGVLLLAAVHASNAYWAVAGLAFAYGSIELTEGPFLAATTTVARQHTMAASAVVNTGGNIGGIIATPIVAFLSANAGWTAAFGTGALFALLSAGLWLWIDSSQQIAVAEDVSGGLDEAKPAGVIKALATAG